MAIRTARTAWNGTLMEGNGQVELTSSGVGTFDTTFPKRTSEKAEDATSAEELIAAAHSTCYSMQLSNMLKENGTPPTQLNTAAAVTFVDGKGITEVHLTVNAQVDGISGDDFQRIAEGAKEECPVSQALKGTDISLTATLA